MNDIWVCSDCKSINRQRDAQCYHCRAPRSGAMETPGLDLRAINAAAERSVRSYIISWPLALITVVLLVGVAVLGVVIVRLQVADFPALKAAFIAALEAGNEPVGDALVTQSVQLGLITLLRDGLTLLALVSLAGWMGLVTRNVPLLGGGTPARSPVRTFVYTLIPIFNLYKVPGMIQDLLYRVDPVEGGAFMVIAATIGLVGSRFVGWIGGWMITVVGIRNLVPQVEAGDLAAVSKTFGDILEQGFWLDVVVAIMVVLGVLILAGIMIRIESRCAARDREIREQMAASGAPSAPEGPGWQVAPAAASTPPRSGVVAADGPDAAGPGSAVTGPVPYEPNWPAGRPWPGSAGPTTTGQVEPALAPAPPDPLAPPPPPPGTPRLG